jgi:ADP-heptose:LPS heptosyltransferase
MVTRTDCRLYRTSHPCSPHKASGTVCEDCTAYEPIEQHIVIVKLGAMGDVLRTTCCLPPLKARYPRSHVTWITRGNAVELLEGNPLIDRILSIDDNYLEYIFAEQFDLAIGPDADQLSASIMYLLRADVKQGITGDGRGGVTPLCSAARGWWQLGLDDRLKRQNRRTYGEWLYAICDLPGPVARPSLPLTATSRARARAFLQAEAPSAQRWICFNTGASDRWKEKSWKSRHYRDLAKSLRADDPSLGVLLLGGPMEAEFNAHLMEVPGLFINGGVTNTIDQLGALINACDLVVTPDSLGYHVACAVGTRALCVVGPTSPWELDTYGINEVVHSDRTCVACYLPACPFEVTCMEDVDAAIVFSRLRLASGPAPSAVRVRPALSGIETQ